jgi:hypothetical protein
VGGLDPPAISVHPRFSFERLSKDLGSTSGNVTGVALLVDMFAIKSVLLKSVAVSPVGHEPDLALSERPAVIV